MTPQQAAAWQDIEAAAVKEGSLTYYGNGIIPQPLVGAFMAAWKKDYPDINIDLLQGNPSDVATRIKTEQDSKKYVGDLTDEGQRAARVWDTQGYLQGFAPPPPATQDPGAKWLFPPVPDMLHPGSLLIMIHGEVPLWINTNLVTAATEPKTHADLLDPQWKDKILWSSPPWVDGPGWPEYYFWKQVDGTDWIPRLQAQNVTFSTDLNAAVNQVARGEFAILIGNNGGATATAAINDQQPLKALWLDDFVTGGTSGIQLLNGAPHPNAAKVLMNWFLSEAGQRFYQSLSLFPNRLDIPPKEPWMQGVTRAQKHLSNGNVDQASVAAAQKEAAQNFKT